MFSIKCKYLGLDIQDDLGRHEVGFIDNTVKNDINDGQGCRMQISFKINKVPGNFHVSTHSSIEKPENPNMAHVINDLTFGEHVENLRSLPDSSFSSLNNAKYESADRKFIYSLLNSLFQILFI